MSANNSIQTIIDLINLKEIPKALELLKSINDAQFKQVCFNNTIIITFLSNLISVDKNQLAFDILFNQICMTKPNNTSLHSRNDLLKVITTCLQYNHTFQLDMLLFLTKLFPTLSTSKQSTTNGILSISSASNDSSDIATKILPILIKDCWVEVKVSKQIKLTALNLIAYVYKHNFHFSMVYVSFIKLCNVNNLVDGLITSFNDGEFQPIAFDFLLEVMDIRFDDK
jgi:hypothetical protein